MVNFTNAPVLQNNPNNSTKNVLWKLNWLINMAFQMSKGWHLGSDSVRGIDWMVVSKG